MLKYGEESKLRYLRLPVNITPTRDELSARCHRRHVLSDLVQIKPRGVGKDANLAFGQCLHLGTSTFWKEVCKSSGLPNGDRLKALDAALHVVNTAWPLEWEGIVPLAKQEYMTQELMQLVLEEYAKEARLAGDLPGEWRLVQAEQRHAFPLDVAGEEFDVAYQTDRLLENEQGQYCIVDTKSASQLSPMWRRTQEQSIQQRCYMALESRRLGKRIDFALVEGVCKKGKAGLLEYVWLNGTWDDAYVEEALLHMAGNVKADRRFLDYVHYLHQLDGIDPEENPERLWDLALDVALSNPGYVGFNTQDCQSFFRDCEYTTLCFANPDDRFGLALDSYEYRGKSYMEGSDD